MVDDRARVPLTLTTRFTVWTTTAPESPEEDPNSVGVARSVSARALVTARRAPFNVRYQNQQRFLIMLICGCRRGSKLTILGR